MEVIIDTATLKKMSGYTRPRDIEKWCEKEGIRYFHGRHGPTTTVDLLNAARGLLPLPPEQLENIL